MEKPGQIHFRVAHKWLDHTASFWAWEQVHDLVAPNRWHLVQVMIAYAPDYSTLCSVAAGPVEDLSCDPAYIPLMIEEAQVNARFRVCLSAAYGMPDEVQRFAEKTNDHEPLPPANAVDATPEEIAIMTAWFHNHDTYWASATLNEWIENAPEDALQVLRVLLKLSDEAPQLREEVFSRPVEAFLRRNATAYREQIEELARQHDGRVERWRDKLIGNSLAVSGVSAFVPG